MSTGVPGLKGARTDACLKSKNPAHGPGFVESDEAKKRATAYPAGCRISGRRAREVIPAAARALVRMTGSLDAVFVMVGSDNERRILAYPSQ
ncbi:MAG: hypothetical protein JSR56_03235 [Proteobacteria bacterium]|nr:hypothetical protein [Pseudomonadota bacterium]